MLWTIGIFLVLFCALVAGGDLFRTGLDEKIGFQLAAALVKSNLT